MAQRGWRQHLSRLCVGFVDMDAPDGTPARDISLGALQLAMTRGDEAIQWQVMPVGPKTIRLLGQPQEIEPSRLTGQQALTSEPEEREPVIPPEGLEVPDEVAAQLGGHDGEITEEGEDHDDEDMVSDLIAYLDLEDAIDAKRQSGDPILAEEYVAAREMRAHLRLAYTEDSAEIDGEVEEVGPTDPAPAAG